MGPRAPDRLVTTCRGCRRRKVGCDRVRPACRQCRAANIQCVYESHGNRSYEFIHETPSGSSSKDASAPDDDEVAMASSLAVPEDRIAALESRVKSLSDVLSTLQQSGSSGTSPLPSAAFESDTPTRPGMSGYLSDQGGGKVRYVNMLSWSTMCRNVAEIDDILLSQSQDAPGNYDYIGLGDDDQILLESTSTAAAEEIRTASAQGSATWGSSSALASFWSRIPSKSFCDSVLRWYFRRYHPLVPLVHVPSFRDEYERFWTTFQNQDSGRSNVISFATLLLSFLYAGSVVGGERYSPTLPTLGHADTMTHLYRLTGTALKHARFPHAPTLDTIRAYLILKSIRMREEEPLSCVAFVGLSVRVANMLGLHKDPNYFAQISPVEAEVRKRIWWQLVHIDVCVAVAAGLPPLIGLHWDVQALSELEDEAIGTPDGIEYQDGVREGRRNPDAAADPSDSDSTSMVSTTGILAAAKHRFAVAQRKFLSRLEAGSVVNEVSEIQLAFDELGGHLQQAIDRIPQPSMDAILVAGLESVYGSALILNRWARLLISTYMDQRFCLMSFPLLRFPSPQQWSGLHAKTMEATMSFLIKCAQLSTEAAYCRFQWSWPGNHQPLHALIVLLNEVLVSPESIYADNIGNVVDVIFALVSEREGFVGNTSDETGTRTRVLDRGGNEVWRYLRRLRARAWRRKGWDPAITISRDEATRLCRDWFVDDVQVLQETNVPHTAAEQQPSAFGLEASDTSLIGLLGDDLWYSGELELPDYGADLEGMSLHSL